MPRCTVTDPIIGSITVPRELVPVINTAPARLLVEVRKPLLIFTDITAEPDMVLIDDNTPLLMLSEIDTAPDKMPVDCK